MFVNGHSQTMNGEKIDKVLTTGSKALLFDE